MTDQNDRTWFDRAGNFHDDALHAVERYSRRVLTPQYEATIEDPNVRSRSRKISMPLYRRLKKNAQIAESKVQGVRRKASLRETL